MKIINVIQRFNVGGIEKLLLEYLRFFKDETEIDYRVVVLEKKQDNIFEQQATESGLKITFLNAEESNNKHYYIRKYLRWKRFDKSLYEYLKKERPDIVHLHNTRLLIKIQWTLKKLHKKFKWFLTLHSDPFAVNKIHVPLAKKAFNEYNIIPICLNKTQFDKAKKRYEISSCEYLNNAIDFENLKRISKTRKQVRKELGVSDDCLLIGCVGRVAEVKNYDFFLEVMKEIVKKSKNVFAVIVGDSQGSDRLKDKLLKLKIENNVVFIGQRDDVSNIYNSIDRFVSTSFTEASSIASLESQYFNNYCIVSEAIPEESVVAKDRVIRLSLSESPLKWADQIVCPTLFEKPLQSISDYDINNVAQKMISLYKKERK